MTREELDRLVEEIALTNKKERITVRQLLDAFNVYRRTAGNNKVIDNYLNVHDVQTIPHYNDVWLLDESIVLQRKKSELTVSQKTSKTPQERISKIIKTATILQGKLTKIKNLKVDNSLLRDLTDCLNQDLCNVLVDDNITRKIKSILEYKLFALENSLKAIIACVKKNPTNKTHIIKNIQNATENIRGISFTIGTFRKLGFLNENLVAIGANGCGKTSLAENIKRYITTNCMVIGAQKLLLVPKLNSVLELEYSQNHLREQQAKNKSLKQPLLSNIDEAGNSIADDVADEFSAVLNNLLSIHNSSIHKFANQVLQDSSIIRQPTLLERVFALWEELMPQRSLKCEDGINIVVQSVDNVEYPAYQLSDGEKVALYLIADVLQTPSDSYIIVDEPETYLHKSIVNKLWDMLENERRKDNCTFVYLTHNLDFAESRCAKKIWIKSYNTKDSLGWDIQEIPNNEIPQELLMDLLGSKRTILFCEGVECKKDISDAKIYEILYPHYTIRPLQSCKNVINYTKAFNQIVNRNCDAVGIIDSDHRSEEQKRTLAAERIFTIGVSEIENLFLLEEFLTKFAAWLHVENINETINKIKEKVKEKFINDIELQTANYVSSKIENIFQENHFQSANSHEGVKKSFEDFTRKINIDNFFNSRKEDLLAIKDDYNQIIKVYNNKGLKMFANQAFNIQNFTERAFQFLREDNEAKEILKISLPSLSF